MNIAVFSDKFSGTLSALEVIEIVKDEFLESGIKADFFSVTDGGQGVQKSLRVTTFK
jgi:glycerate kinase